MRRLALILSLLITLSAGAPALAAEGEVCGDLAGYARLNASGAGTATGWAIVAFAGGVQLVTIDSQITGPTVSQQWHFNEGTIDVVETPAPVPLRGPWQLVDSDVEVVGGGEGDWTYDGLFNEDTLVARFVVAGDPCIATE